MARTIGIITGSGTYAVPGLRSTEPRDVSTRFGTARLTAGRLGDTDVLHLSRHLEGHPRLSNHVEHRANIAALKEAGAVAGPAGPEAKGSFLA